MSGMHHIPLCIQGLATETKRTDEMSFSCTQDGIGINFAQCRKTHMVATCSVNKECVVVLLLYLPHVQSIYIPCDVIEEWVYTCLPDQNHSAIYTIFIP